MPHHGDRPMESGLPEWLKEKLGATGQFPRGRIDPTDEGQLAMAISNRGGKIFIHFGKPTAWIGLDPKDANELAKLLMQNAVEAQQS